MARWNHLVGLGKVPLLCNAHGNRTEQLMFLPILQFFPSVSTISSKTIQNEHWSTVSQYFHCLSPRCYISNESLLLDKKGEQIMLCRLDLYSHNGTEIKPKNHVVPIDPRKPRESCSHFIQTLCHSGRPTICCKNSPWSDRSGFVRRWSVTFALTFTWKPSRRSLLLKSHSLSSHGGLFFVLLAILVIATSLPWGDLGLQQLRQLVVTTSISASSLSARWPHTLDLIWPLSLLSHFHFSVFSFIFYTNLMYLLLSAPDDLTH